MKNLFPQYRTVSTDKHKIAWEKALFIFDANVLLNLYRYQKNTSSEFIAAIQEIKNRADVWIPYQVAAEFYRNRLYVMANQNNVFGTLKNKIEKSKKDVVNIFSSLELPNKHYSIKVNPFLESFTALVDSFLSELDELKKTCWELSGEDEVIIAIEDIFDGKVGEKPKDQKSIDTLYKEAEERYKLFIPPGYKDAKSKQSDKGEPSGYLLDGIVYQKKYGDFIIWKQILEYATVNENITHVIFVTDDQKEDWWLKIDSQELRTIGPRFELIEEILHSGKVEYFQMYKFNSFLHYAREYLGVKVSETAIEEVVNIAKFDAENLVPDFRFFASLAHDSVYNWISNQVEYSEIYQNIQDFPDIMARKHNDDSLCGFEIRFIHGKGAVNIERLWNKIDTFMEKSDLIKFTLVLVALDKNEAENASSYLLRRYPEILSKKINIMTGVYEPNENKFIFLMNFGTV